jgi:hypothetical protein
VHSHPIPGTFTLGVSGVSGVHVELAISPADAFADDLPGGSLINEQEAFFRRCSLE